MFAGLLRWRVELSLAWAIAIIAVSSSITGTRTRELLEVSERPARGRTIRLWALWKPHLGCFFTSVGARVVAEERGRGRVSESGTEDPGTGYAKVRERAAQIRQQGVTAVQPWCFNSQVTLNLKGRLGDVQ